MGGEVQAARRGPAATCFLAGKVAQGRWHRLAAEGVGGGGQSVPGHQAGFPALW